MKTLKNIFASFAVLFILGFLSANASGDTVMFSTSFYPTPSLTAKKVGYSVYINKSAETLRAISFSVKTNAVFNEIDSLKFHVFDQDGNLSTENVQCIAAIDNTRTTPEFMVYNFSVYIGDNQSRIHRSEASDDLYKLFYIEFYKGWAAENFETNSYLEFSIDNIAMSKNNSSHTLPVKSVNSHLATETIFYTFRPDGDVNNDGLVNILDVTPVAKHIVKITPLIGTAKLRADVAPINAPDNFINILDLNGILMIIGGEYYVAENSKPICVPLHGRKKFTLQKASSIFIESSGQDYINNHTGLEKADIEYSADKKSIAAVFSAIQEEINVEFFTNNTIDNGFAICQGSNLSSNQETDNEENPDFCYPNPTADYITISNPYYEYNTAAELIIMDLSGQIIDKTTQNEAKIIYNTKHLNSGSYIYCLQNANDNIIFGKFVVKK